MAFNIDIQHRHSTLAFNIGIQHWHSQQPAREPARVPARVPAQEPAQSAREPLPAQPARDSHRRGAGAGA